VAHAGRVLIEQLEKQGASVLFTVPGESFLAALDGMHETSRIRPIICRQEGGASMMADAWGKMTGEPGICFVTRGPGAANAMSGLHVAQQDSTPLIMFLGLPGAEHEDREAFQEIDVKGLFGTFVKWSAVIRDPNRIAEYVSRAYHTALSGRPGPVVLGLPEDMLASVPSEVREVAPARPAVSAPAPDAMESFGDALAKAERPLFVVGGPGWNGEIREDLQAFAARTGIPIATSFRAQDSFDNRHPNYAGCAGIGIGADLAKAVREADLLVAVGARLGEMTTGAYTLVESPEPKQSLAHIHPDPSEIGRVFRADHPIAATTGAFISALSKLDLQAKPAWAAQSEALHAAYLKSLEPVGVPGDVKLDHVIAELSRVSDDDTIICNGAGNYAAFTHRFYQYRGYRTQLAPTSGSMGYGVPAAVAAQLAAPKSRVIAMAGDGCFMMTCQELATAMQYDLPIVIIISNNGMYGTIRMHQERDYPSRVVATNLTNPDFAAFARSFGAHGETVTKTEEFGPALERSLAAGTAAVIELKIDPEAITPRQTLTEIRNS
jgi:acetolactate synthase-1/2/3 large subunit